MLLWPSHHKFNRKHINTFGQIFCTQYCEWTIWTLLETFSSAFYKRWIKIEWRRDKVSIFKSFFVYLYPFFVLSYVSPCLFKMKSDFCILLSFLWNRVSKNIVESWIGYQYLHILTLLYWVLLTIWSNTKCE